MQIFKIIGDAALAENLPNALSTQEKNVTNVMKIKYGVVIRVRYIVRLTLYSSISKPGASNHITNGIAISNIATKAVTAKVRIISELLANSKAFSLSPVETLPLNNGTKAELNAPSAKIPRKKFGSLNATLKASAYNVAPKFDATNKSRISPKILDIKV